MSKTDLPEALMVSSLAVHFDMHVHQDFLDLRHLGTVVDRVNGYYDTPLKSALPDPLHSPAGIASDAQNCPIACG